MKLSELDRAHLEIIDLKIKLINSQTEKLMTLSDQIIKEFCDANGLDVAKVKIDIRTGEVKLIEEKNEVNDAIQSN
jgi:hypothetical protein